VGLLQGDSLIDSTGKIGALVAAVVALSVLLVLLWPSSERSEADRSAMLSVQPAEAAPPRPRDPPETRRAPAAGVRREPATPTTGASALPPPSPNAPALRTAFEREGRNETSASTEDTIRAIFTARDGGAAVFRGAICKRSVCRVDLDWSPSLAAAYDAALLELIGTRTRELSLEPEGRLSDIKEPPVPMTLFIARRGHGIQSILREQARP
jgi:hypothetical protein